MRNQFTIFCFATSALVILPALARHESPEALVQAGDDFVQADGADV